MKIVKLWINERIEIVKDIKKDYMPEHYEKNAICINGHYVYLPKDKKTMIKEVSKETEKEIKKLQAKQKRLFDNIKKVKEDINIIIKNEFMRLSK